MSNHQSGSGFSQPLVICIIVLFIVLAGIIYLNKNQNNDQPITTVSQTVSDKNWQTYTSPEYTIIHHYDNVDSTPEPHQIQFSIRYPKDWIVRTPTNEYPLILEKGSNKISIQKFDNQTGQLCEILNGAKTGKHISSPYANLLRVKSPFNTIRADTIEFIICAADAPPTDPNHSSDITKLGKIHFDLPLKYNQADLDEMDLIISTLTKIKMT